ncbi:unnamed protein product, partial [Rotaria sp. Silwood2]
HHNTSDRNNFVHEHSSQYRPQATEDTASNAQISHSQNIPRQTEESLLPNHQSYQSTEKSIERSEFQIHQEIPQSTTTPRSTPQATDEATALRAEIDKFREQNSELIQCFQKSNIELKRKKIDSFEALIEQDKEMQKIFIELTNLTPPMPMEGNNIALFGLTSTGKSTMLNSILGQKLAETGVGETTKKIVSYPSSNFTLWDVPGRNDEMSYMNMEYISFFKGLSKRLILIEATVKENSSMMKLLDAIQLPYAIVFNKFDKADDDEQQQIQQQIEHEHETLGLQKVDQVFFVSGKFPNKFPGWQAMLHYMRNSRH